MKGFGVRGKEQLFQAQNRKGWGTTGDWGFGLEGEGGVMGEQGWERDHEGLHKFVNEGIARRGKLEGSSNGMSPTRSGGGSGSRGLVINQRKKRSFVPIRLGEKESTLRLRRKGICLSCVKGKKRKAVLVHSKAHR